jgi:hypothetical protein
LGGTFTWAETIVHLVADRFLVPFHWFPGPHLFPYNGLVGGALPEFLLKQEFGVFAIPGRD